MFRFFKSGLQFWQLPDFGNSGNSLRTSNQYADHKNQCSAQHSLQRWLRAEMKKDGWDVEMRA
jgi:hypothetical protein